MSEPRDERIETNPDADLDGVPRDDALLDAIGASREPAFATLPGRRRHPAADSVASRRGDVRRRTDRPADPGAGRGAGNASDRTPLPTRFRTGAGTLARLEVAASATLRGGHLGCSSRRRRAVRGRGRGCGQLGNPLTPLKAVVSGLAPQSEQDGAAAITGVMPRELASVRADILEGHLDDARRKLTDVRRAGRGAQGPDQIEPALVVIEALEEQIQLAKQATPSATTSPSSSATPTDSATPTPTPTPTGTSTPTPSPAVEPTPTTSNGLGLGRARVPGEHPESPVGGRYDGGPSS